MISYEAWGTSWGHIEHTASSCSIPVVVSWDYYSNFACAEGKEVSGWTNIMKNKPVWTNTRDCAGDEGAVRDANRIELEAVVDFAVGRPWLWDFPCQPVSCQLHVSKDGFISFHSLIRHEVKGLPYLCSVILKFCTQTNRCTEIENTVLVSATFTVSCRSQYPCSL